jgi:hypothetical protein
MWANGNIEFVPFHRVFLARIIPAVCLQFHLPQRRYDFKHGCLLNWLIIACMAFLWCNVMCVGDYFSTLATIHL